MKSIILLATIAVFLTPYVGYAQTSDHNYPNELSQFRFYSTAKWKVLRPLESDMDDVRRLLGPPTDVHDVSQYTKPYPGDAAAKRPVFSYDLGNDWEMLVYFLRYCFYDGPTFPASMGDRLCTIDLVPKKRIPFGAIEFPAAFKKKHVTAVDGAWDEFADGSGLVYEVYTIRTPSGEKLPGDLNRIVYGPSDETTALYAKAEPCPDKKTYTGKYTNLAFGFSIVIPAGLKGYWNSARCAPDEKYGCVCMGDHGRFIPLSDDSSIEAFVGFAVEDEWTLRQYENQEVTYVKQKQGVQQVKVLSSKWTTLGGLKGRRFVVQFIENNKTIVVDHIIALHKGVEYELILRTLADRRALDTREFEKVISSWRLTPRVD